MTSSAQEIRAFIFSEQWRRIAWLDDEAYADNMLGLMGFDYYH